MSAHPPPVPPDNRSPKGPGESPATSKGASDKIHPEMANPNPDQIGESGAAKQNTTNQGYQQDR
jgi:hypothetical protein